jgi:cystathionine beta-lyase
MSDELHAGLILDGEHIPIASLSPEVAQRTVTLTGPCKTYNTAGLGGGVAISHNKALLSRLKKATVGVMGHPNVAAMAMWTAALHHAEPWRQQVLGYLRANRDYLGQFLAQRLPQVGYQAPQGTYLAWLDFSAYNLPSRPQDVFLKAGVALNEGSTFGKEYPSCVRLNFATSRPILSEALERMAAAIS